jgi:superoxide dismutase, Fe-Mn family
MTMRYSAALLALTIPALITAPPGAVAQNPAANPSQSAQSAPASDRFTLAPLPYGHDALEPVIDAATMELHHSKHHQGYVDNLNEAVAGDPALAGLSLEQIVARSGTLSTTLRDNAGGHWNHTFFWESMAPVGQGGDIAPALMEGITATFGSLDEMKSEFNSAGTDQFGSGWVWLIMGDDGKLAITSTPNQDNPLMDVAEVKGAPLLGNDVWEHAYYLKYQNRRADYLDAWWQVVDWAKVSERFAAARRD